MADEKQITIIPRQELGPISPNPDKVAALADRMLAELAFVGVQKLEKEERISLALQAIIYNLVPGREIWYIKSKGIMIGRAGWTKRMNEMSTEEDFKWYTDYRLARSEDYEDARIDPSKVHLAWVCIMRRTDWTEAWTDSMKNASDAGMPWDEISQNFGRIPMITGLGVIWKSEIGKGLKKDTQGMTITSRGKKRAFADCASQIVHFPFPNILEGRKINDSDTVADEEDLQLEDFTDGEITEETPAPPTVSPESSEEGVSGADTPTEQTERQEALPLPSAETMMSSLTGNHIAAICQSAWEAVGADNDFHFIARMKKHYPEAKGNYKSVLGTFGDFITKMKTSSTPGKEKSGELEKHFDPKESDDMRACVECGAIGKYGEEVMPVHNDKGEESFLCADCFDEPDSDEAEEVLPWDRVKKSKFWNRASTLGLRAKEIYAEADVTTPAEFFRDYGEIAAHAKIEEMAKGTEE